VRPLLRHSVCRSFSAVQLSDSCARVPKRYPHTHRTVVSASQRGCGLPVRVSRACTHMHKHTQEARRLRFARRAHPRETAPLALCSPFNSLEGWTRCTRHGRHLACGGERPLPHRPDRQASLKRHQSDHCASGHSGRVQRNAQRAQSELPVLSGQHGPHCAAPRRLRDLSLWPQRHATHPCVHRLDHMPHLHGSSHGGAVASKPHRTAYA
jgi:hypothetical protein